MGNILRNFYGANGCLLSPVQCNDTYPLTKVYFSEIGAAAMRKLSKKYLQVDKTPFIRLVLFGLETLVQLKN